jgi:hypothetical protein
MGNTARAGAACSRSGSPPYEAIRKILAYSYMAEAADFIEVYQEWAGVRLSLECEGRERLEQAARETKERDHVFSLIVEVYDWLEREQAETAGKPATGG